MDIMFAKFLYSDPEQIWISRFLTGSGTDMLENLLYCTQDPEQIWISSIEGKFYLLHVIHFGYWEFHFLLVISFCTFITLGNR